MVSYRFFESVSWRGIPYLPARAQQEIPDDLAIALGLLPATEQKIPAKLQQSVLWKGLLYNAFEQSHLTVELALLLGFNVDGFVLPPRIVDIENQTLTADGSAFSLQFLNTGGTEGLTWAAAGLPTGFSLAGDTVSATLDTEVPARTITVTATNDGGSDTETFSLSVAAIVLNPPVITPIDDLTLTADGSNYTFQPANTGGTSGVTWTATGLPGNWAINATTGAITAVLSSAIAETSVTITATNADGADTEEFSITVAFASAGAPVIAPIDNVTLTDTGAAYTLQPVNTGGTAGVTWSATGLPVYWSIDSSTGLITAALNTEVPATSITVTAAGSGGTDTETFILTVTADPVWTDVSNDYRSEFETATIKSNGTLLRIATVENDGVYIDAVRDSLTKSWKLTGTVTAVSGVVQLSLNDGGGTEYEETTTALAVGDFELTFDADAENGSNALTWSIYTPDAGAVTIDNLVWEEIVDAPSTTPTEIYVIAEQKGFDDVAGTEQIIGVLAGQSNSLEANHQGRYKEFLSGVGTQPYLLVTSHEGSTGFFSNGPWSPNGELAKALIDEISVQVSAAENGVVFSPIFWWQGEADSTSQQRVDAYRTSLEGLIANVKAQTGVDLNWQILLLNSASSYAFKAEMRTVQQAVVAANPRLYSFDTNPYAMLADGRHYANAQYQEITNALIAQANANDLATKLTVLTPRVVDVSIVGSPVGTDSSYQVQVNYATNTAAPLAAQTPPTLSADIPGQTETATLTPTGDIVEGATATVIYDVVFPSGLTLNDAIGAPIVRTSTAGIYDTNGNQQRQNAAVWKAPVGLPPTLTYNITSDGVPFTGSITSDAPTVWTYSDGFTETTNSPNHVLPDGPGSVTGVFSPGTTIVRNSTCRIDSVQGFQSFPDNVLIQVRLDDNNLTEIPAGLSGVQSKITGYFFGLNTITSLTSSLVTAPALRTLDVTNAGLTSLPDETTLGNVINLYLDGNNLSELPNLQNLSTLRKLRLRNNQLTTEALDALLVQLINNTQGNPSELSIAGNPGLAGVNQANLATVRAQGWTEG